MNKTSEREVALLKAALLDPVAGFAYADWLDEQGRNDEAGALRRHTGFVRRVEFTPAWDKRNPRLDKSYGIGGVTASWSLVGPSGAATFVLFTNWMLPHVTEETAERLPSFTGEALQTYVRALYQPRPADLGYHSKKPMYEGHEVCQLDCPFLGGVPCYYDGSGTVAQRVFESLLEKGDAGVWDTLERYYHETFGG